MLFLKCFRCKLPSFGDISCGDLTVSSNLCGAHRKSKINLKTSKQYLLFGNLDLVSEDYTENSYWHRLHFTCGAQSYKKVKLRKQKSKVTLQEKQTLCEPLD